MKIEYQKSAHQSVDQESSRKHHRSKTINKKPDRAVYYLHIDHKENPCQVRSVTFDGS